MDIFKKKFRPSLSMFASIKLHLKMFVLFKLKLQVHIISVQIRLDPCFFFFIIKTQKNHKWLTIESIKSYQGLFLKSACNSNPTVSEMLTFIDHILFVIYNVML